MTSFDHRAFPLELLNGASSPRPGTDSEVAAIGRLDPDAGWRLWQAPDWAYPSTTLPALEAVQAAKEQSLAASETLDLGLRRAFWVESRNISLRTVILAIATETGALDIDALTDTLDTGRARHLVIEQYRTAQTHAVVCSPHLFLPDGTNHANPGIQVHYTADYGVASPSPPPTTPASTTPCSSRPRCLLPAECGLSQTTGTLAGRNY